MTDAGAQPGSDAPYDYRHSTVEEDRKAASLAQERYERLKEQRQSHANDDKNDSDNAEQDRRDKAARVLQGRYKEHRPANLTFSARFSDGLKAKELADASQQQTEGKNDPATRWKRTELYASKISEGSKAKGGAPELSEEQELKMAKNEKERKQLLEEREASKSMGAKYWLEVVDSEHRYASNLKWYHAAWQDSDTPENFFYWLDSGEGSKLDLEQCPRSRLNREKIVYLNASERQNYRLEEKSGKLVWAKNGELFDTSKYHKDAGSEHGIVPITREEYQQQQNRVRQRRKEIRDQGEDLPSSSSSESSSGGDEGVQEGAKPYNDKGGTAGQGKGFKQFKNRVKYYASPSAVADRMLRKSINANTWLYVVDLEGKIYSGIKKTGRFQHSSLLYGARVMSAGEIKAENGQITSLTPLSGHYRSGTIHFKAFLRSLDQQGVDLSHVYISKSILTIRALEKYGAATQEKQNLIKKLKIKLGKEKTDKEKEDEEAEKDEKLVKNQTEKREHSSQQNSDPSASKDLPHEGKRIEDLSEKERDERGVALIQRAFSKMSVEQISESDESEPESEQDSKGK